MSNVFTNKTLNTPTNQFSNKYDLEPAEVVDVIYDSNHPRYRLPYDIGAIIFRRVFSDYKKTDTQLSIARIGNSSIKSYPLKHEIVNIWKSLNTSSGTFDKVTSFYYDTIVNIWGYVNHNALPYSTDAITGQTQESTANFTGIAPSNTTEIELGKYFVENINIPNLIPFEGDTIISGRFGNTIRFTSTQTQVNNTWSKDGIDNDPLIIIKNTNLRTDENYIIENINNDNSSIYLTTSQQINLTVASTKTDSFVDGDEPINPIDFNTSQFITSADRILLNSKSDSILMYSNSAIGLSAANSINLDADKYIAISTPKLYIGTGAENEAEPVVLGTQLLDTLDKIISELLKMTFGTGVGPTTPMLPPSAIALTQLQTQLQTQKYILSKISFTK